MLDMIKVQGSLLWPTPSERVPQAAVDGWEPAGSNHSLQKLLLRISKDVQFVDGLTPRHSM